MTGPPGAPHVAPVVKPEARRKSFGSPSPVLRTFSGPPARRASRDDVEVVWR